MAVLAGCGSTSATDGHRAESAAMAGCHQLLALGGSLSGAPRSQSFAGASINRELGAAQADLDRAAKLDHAAWGPTDAAVRSFYADLRAGRTPANSLAIALTNGCQGFAASP